MDSSFRSFRFAPTRRMPSSGTMIDLEKPETPDDYRPRVLVIAYFYPPDLTGVRRLVANLRVWSAMGLDPIVLTCGAKRGAGNDHGPLTDPLISKLPVYTSGSWDPWRLTEFFKPHVPGKKNLNTRNENLTSRSSGLSRNLMKIMRRNVWVPDDRMLWIGPATKLARRLIKFYPSIEAIYTSNYPQSAHLLGMNLKKDFPELRWLADFRDGWTQNPAFHDPGHSLMARWQKQSEKKVCELADEIVTVSPPITDWLQTLRPPAKPDVQTITNGFDPADFDDARIQSETPSESDESGTISIVHTGTFFGRRHPRDFFRLVCKLLKTKSDWRNRISIRFFGELSSGHLAFAEKCGIDSSILEIHPTVSFQECLRQQQKADILLLILERGPGSDIMVSQKVFEYLASRKPIYALIPDGAAATILRQTGGAAIETSRPSLDSLNRFEDFLKTVSKDRFPLPEPEDLRPFHRKIQAQKLAGLMVSEARDSERENDT